MIVRVFLIPNKNYKQQYRALFVLISSRQLRIVYEMRFQKYFLNHIMLSVIPVTYDFTKLSNVFKMADLFWKN